MNIVQLGSIDNSQLLFRLNAVDIELIAQQIQKDFELSGSSFDFDSNGIKTLEQLLSSLIKIISSLIQTSPKGLMNLLYRADIPEKEVSQSLIQHRDLDSAIVISVLLLLKANKKLELRRRFKK